MPAGGRFWPIKKFLTQYYKLPIPILNQILSTNSPIKLHIPTISEAQTATDIVIKFLEHEKQTIDLKINNSLDIQKFWFQLAQNSPKQKTVNDIFRYAN